MSTKTENYDVLIAGQGAAAFAAGLYAARYQMKSIIIGETFGGETATGGLIENYPGYADIDGFDLMMKFREQVASYDVPILDDKVTTVAKNSNDFKTPIVIYCTYLILDHLNKIYAGHFFGRVYIPNSF